MDDSWSYERKTSRRNNLRTRRRFVLLVSSMMIAFRTQELAVQGFIAKHRNSCLFHHVYSELSIHRTVTYHGRALYQSHGPPSTHGHDVSHPDNIISPVLRQVYPAILDQLKTFGNPNIPLGSPEGRQCATLRRLRNQNKLAESDVLFLDRLGFTWHSLEDVYEKQKDHFDEFLDRLKIYASTNEGDLSPPKKYPADPELGAWITAVRRLRMVDNAVDKEHIDALTEIGFEWVSPRKCGSKFMTQYRSIQERLRTEGDAVWNDPEVKKWIYAQQKADLSETRKHYMTLILGPDWMSWSESG